MQSLINLLKFFVQRFEVVKLRTDDLQEVKKIESADGEHYIAIYLLPHGRYRYDEYAWLGPWEEDGVTLSDGAWSSRHLSGLYETVEAAEADARATTSWLKN